jgi:hypothetical protein
MEMDQSQMEMDQNQVKMQILSTREKKEKQHNHIMHMYHLNKEKTKSSCVLYPFSFEFSKAEKVKYAFLECCYGSEMNILPLNIAQQGLFWHILQRASSIGPPTPPTSHLANVAHVARHNGVRPQQVRSTPIQRANFRARDPPWAHLQNVRNVTGRHRARAPSNLKFALHFCVHFVYMWDSEESHCK